MNKALEIINLTKIYSGGVVALNGIDLAVQQGDFFALLGPNGAGKSTTLGVVTSLINKTSGQVRVMGHDLDSDMVNAKMNLGVVPQEFNFNQFETVFDIVVTQAGYYGIAQHRAESKAEYYLKKLGLWDKRSTAARMLSGGMKRRLMIARALVHEPKVLILDEPTAGVDIELRRSMWDFLQEINRRGTTIILTTHYLEEAEALCRNIAIINHGVILEHTSKKNLLDKLSVETLLLDVDNAPKVVPKIDEFELRLHADGGIEVEVNKGQTLNTLFALLTERGVSVKSVRTKTNRLEELFVRMVE